MFPWPTFLVLDYLDFLITPITSLINASLDQGKCPNFFKHAHVTPILKISSLNKEVFKNYRPVSNLNFISKVFERVVAIQLQTHFDEGDLMTVFKSAYRKYHSTKSAPPPLIFIMIFSVWPKGLSLPLTFWISPLHSIPLTTLFS